MSLAVYLVKKETRSLSSVHVANRDPLIESRIYISLSPFLPPRSLSVDGEKDWLENWFSRIIAILFVGEPQVSPRLFPITAAGSPIYLPWENTWRGPQPLACAIVKVEAWSKHDLWWVQRRDSEDLECLTSVTHNLKHRWHVCFLIRSRICFSGCCHGAVGWAAAQAEADELLRMERVLVSPLLWSLLLLCFCTHKAGVYAPALCYKCHGGVMEPGFRAVTLLRDVS